MHHESDFGTRSIDDAKARLNIKRLALQIHDASLPATPDEDVGRGSPYSYGAEQFFTFIAGLGFDTIQFGPHGMTGRGNASPYDGTIFSRNPLNLPLARLVDEGRLPRASFRDVVASLHACGRTPAYSALYDAFESAQREIVAAASSADRAASGDFLFANAEWLLPDAIYAVLSRIHGRPSWRDWGGSTQGVLDQRLYHPESGAASAAARRIDSLRAEYQREIENYALIQFILDTQHQGLRDRLHTLRLEVFADLQVGLSLQDTWAYQGLFLPGYRLGAPPSRTNPLGQPWGYPVFDPNQYGSADAPGPVLNFVRARIRKAVAESDGVRIDHPHGWIDPWVYGDDDLDPFHAVRQGARLFSTPNDPRHPQLAQFSIARIDQLAREEPEFGEERVRDLDRTQVARYSALIDEVVAASRVSDSASESVACEVLSTLPRPVAEVLRRHRLGRFRVVQKINLNDRTDVYRIEHARPEDWVMLGTHDSPPIWLLANAWCVTEQGAAWRQYATQRLGSDWDPTSAPEEMVNESGALVNCVFSAMLTGEARHVLVFFADLFGLTRRYNEPGLVNDVNWTLHAPSDFAAEYARRLAKGEALDLKQHFELAAKCSSVRR
ncbi:MAG: 4-alpha-glucanotransferase [Planctomycetia bacterium]|nr:4-alpha-glucanotransferase [Planctomycetia bacterium]